MNKYDIVIVGGGSAGLAAALSAYEAGNRSILILERDQEPGGILLQCIHNGFGLHTFHEELAGPAYAEKYITMLKDTSVEVKLNTMVTHLYANKHLEYVNKDEGYVEIKAEAIILAMGCRERTRGAIAIPGYRPSGVYTAGTAQRYLNMDGYLVGKRVFILGSGDIGLIMARRMSLEGAKVLGVAELMPYSNGLPRNLKQCLEDFEIPLYLSHTVTRIDGKERVSGIEISQVDAKLQPIKGSEKYFEVDTLLLSVGLIPENALSEEVEIKLHPRTKGPIVNESYMTSVEGIFACGNVLHVHDLVDFVSSESSKAGYYAAKYVKQELSLTKGFEIITKGFVSYVVPSSINCKNMNQTVELLFRVSKEERNVKLNLYKDGVVYKTIKKVHVAPAEMEKLVLKYEELMDIKESLTIEMVVD